MVIQSVTENSDTVVPTIANLGYMAGFVDGEGCLYISRTPWHGRIQYQLRLTCSQLNPAPLYLFQKFFGGRVSYEDKKRPTWRPIYKWEVRGSSAGKALRLFLPYLIVKKDEALVALEFQDKVSSAKRGTPITEEVQQDRDVYYWGLKTLKKRSW